MNPSRLLCMLLLLLGALDVAAETHTAIAVNRSTDRPIGPYVGYLRETHNRLSLDDAEAAYRNGAFKVSGRAVLDFGIGAKPVWLHFQVKNDSAHAVPQRLSVETPWLDHVDTYFLHSGQTQAIYHVGDSKPFNARAIDSRYFAFSHRFDVGISDVFLRVQTPDPMVLPLFLTSPAQAEARETRQSYGYGFLYGFLIALLGYNAMLYVGLRRRRYMLYSTYLGMFMLANMSYTGHGFAWFWPDQPGWAQWSNPILMLLYGISGLAFAVRFLNVRKHFPRLYKGILAFIGISVGLMLSTAAFDSQHYALLLAFVFIFLFTMIMLAIGIVSVRSGQRPARYFLLAAIASMIGALLTEFSVWGFIPYNTWTFHAVDIGMLLDATLLALALTYQFRVGQEQKQRAERLATLDPLTRINNRRAFYDIAGPIWNLSLRHGRSLSVILVDIDHFKRINDAYGHAYGDSVLVETANVLAQTMRGQDIVARWGGEEFILLLPETDLYEAAALAERLRKTVADIRLYHAGVEIKLTASFGVAQRQQHHASLDALISSADGYLYQSKDVGRNKVSYA